MAFNHQQYNTEYLLNSKRQGTPINDSAEKYGVRIVEVEVAPGETYWKVIGVHHLLPRENFSNHHVYLEALDEDGNRLKNPPGWAGWTWEGRRPHETAQPVVLDKPDNEAAGNIMLFFGQKVTAWMKGVSRDGQDKSDRVENMHTTHPDEPLPDGTLLNTLGHHSFYVVFQRTRKGRVAANGIISGRVESGQGLKVQLLQTGQVLAEQMLDSDLTYKFENLSFGAYQVALVDTDISQDNINLDPVNKEQTVNLAVPPPDDSVIFGEVKNGQGKVLLLVKEGNIISRLPLPPSGQYRFENLAKGNYTVLVFETSVRQDNIVLDGLNTRRLILTVPEPSEVVKNINHYLLFGPPASRGRQINFLLALDYIQTFSLTVGFNVEVAKLAQQVTIIGEGISEAEKQAIKDSGSELEVLSGDAYDLEAKLNARVQAGRAFGD